MRVKVCWWKKAFCCAMACSSRLILDGSNCGAVRAQDIVGYDLERAAASEVRRREAVAGVGHGGLDRDPSSRAIPAKSVVMTSTSKSNVVRQVSFQNQGTDFDGHSGHHETVLAERDDARKRPNFKSSTASELAIAVNHEFADIGSALRSLDQSYFVRGFQGCAAATSGAAFLDWDAKGIESRDRSSVISPPPIVLGTSSRIGAYVGVPSRHCVSMERTHTPDGVCIPQAHRNTGHINQQPAVIEVPAIISSPPEYSVPSSACPCRDCSAHKAIRPDSATGHSHSGCCATTIIVVLSGTPSSPEQCRCCSDLPSERTPVLKLREHPHRRLDVNPDSLVPHPTPELRKN